MLRLGVIGYGRRIRHILATLDRYEAGAKVVAVADPRVEELRRDCGAELADAKLYADADRMLDAAGLDGVLVGTRCNLHTPCAVKVLERDLPLFLEKPVAIDWEQLRALKAAADRSKSPVVVSFPLRVSAMCNSAREIVDSGVIGSIEQVQAVNNVPYGHGYYHGWMRDEAQTGGLWMQKATHDLDYLNSLVRQMPVRIAAMESKTVFRGDMPAGLRCVDCPRQEQCLESPYNLFYRHGVTGRVEANSWQCSFATDTGNHDSASALIQYESGIHAVYTQNLYIRRGAAARGVTLVGYRGTLSFDWYTDEVTVHHHFSNKVERIRFESTGEGHHGGDKELAHDFIAILTGKGESRAPLEAGILSCQMCLMARDSCQGGGFVEYRPL